MLATDIILCCLSGESLFFFLYLEKATEKPFVFISAYLSFNCQELFFPFRFILSFPSFMHTPPGSVPSSGVTKLRPLRSPSLGPISLSFTAASCALRCLGFWTRWMSPALTCLSFPHLRFCDRQWEDRASCVLDFNAVWREIDKGEMIGQTEEKR